MLAGLLGFAAVVAVAIPIRASEAFVASLRPDAKVTVSVGARQAESEPVVRVSGVDAITVPITGGSATVFSSADTEIELTQELSEIVAAFSFRPGDRLYYTLTLAAIRDFEIEFSSGSHVNSLGSFDMGFRWGLGVGGVLVPGSIVSTAVTWDAAYSRTQVGLERFESETGVSSVNHRFEQEEFQASVAASRRWNRIEPFAGVKVFRLDSDLKDRGTKQRVSGTVEGVSPFVGAQYWLSEKEIFRIGASFVDEESVHASLGVSF